MMGCGPAFAKLAFNRRHLNRLRYGSRMSPLYRRATGHPAISAPGNSEGPAAQFAAPEGVCRLLSFSAVRGGKGWRAARGGYCENQT